MMPGLAGMMAYAKNAAEITTEKAAEAKRVAVSLVNIVRVSFVKCAWG